MNKPIIKDHVWKAESYHSHSSVQNNAAVELLKHISIKGNEKILDVGCGDGKITAWLSTQVFNNGFVLGIDKAQEMIEFAQNMFSKAKYRNLEFLQQDAQYLSYKEEFNMVFSSFALQWFADSFAFFKGAYESLKPQGLLAITVPLDISSALENAIKIVTSKEEWFSYFNNFSAGVYFKKEEELKELLSLHNLQLLFFDKQDQQVYFSSREDFEKYVLPWFSYLNAIPPRLQLSFFKEIIDEYLKNEPENVEGEVYLRFSRVDMIGIKNC